MILLQKKPLNLRPSKITRKMNIRFAPLRGKITMKRIVLKTNVRVRNLAKLHYMVPFMHSCPSN